MEIEIIESGQRAPGTGQGEVTIMGHGTFRPGDRVSGKPKDLQPLVDTGHAKLWEAKPAKAGKK